MKYISSLYKKGVNILIIVLMVMIIGIAFRHKLFLLRPTRTLSLSAIDTLSILGSKAIPSLDVPVSSLLIYQGEIIGQGYNTVNADTNVAGHAEINAINAGIRLCGFEKFKQLDRDKLILVTTFEPCAMCRGAIIGSGIKHVEFIKAKSLPHLWKEDLKQLRYECQKVNVGPMYLQDSLFHLHPLYHGSK